MVRLGEGTAVSLRGWESLPAAAIGGPPGAPVRVDLAAIHPRRGIALIDIAPKATGQAAETLRRRLAAEVSGKASLPPVVYLCLAPEEVAELPMLLERAFAGARALPGGGWVAAARRAMAEPAAAPEADAVIPRGMVATRPGQAPAVRRPGWPGLLAGAIGLAGLLAAPLMLRAPGNPPVAALHAPSAAIPGDGASDPPSAPPGPGAGAAEAPEIPPAPELAGAAPAAPDALATAPSGAATDPAATDAHPGDRAEAPTAVPEGNGNPVSPPASLPARAAERPPAAAPPSRALSMTTAPAGPAPGGARFGAACAPLLARLQLGETPTHEDRQRLRTGCAPRP